MLHYHNIWIQPKVIRKLLLGCCLTLICFLISPAQASAHVMNTPTASLSLRVDVGFNSNYRIGYWTPVRVTLNNNGADFHGTLAINTSSGGSTTGAVGAVVSPWNFATPITLAKGAQKQVTLSVPLYMWIYPPFNIVAKVLDTHGRTVTTQEVQPNYLNPYEVLVGIFSDHGAGFNPLTTVKLPYRNSTIALAPLDAPTMPTTTAVLSNFDVLVFDDFATSTLSPIQLGILESWVNQGGALIEVGAEAWQRTLKALPPELLPVEVNGTTTLPAGTHLFPIGSAGTQQPLIDTLSQPVVASTATLRSYGQGTSSTFESETVLSAGTTPLLVQSRHGQGVILYLAFDPALEPLVGWSSISAFWKSLLFRAIGDQALLAAVPKFSSGPGEILAKGGLVQVLQPPTLFSIWVVGLFLLCYLIVLGPVGLLIVRRLKRPEWRWRISISTMVIFSFCFYGLTFVQRGAALLDNSISIVQLNQDGSPAHITTYQGLYVPSQGDFQVHLPGNSLALPIRDPLLYALPVFSADDPHATIVSAADGANVNVSNSGSWTYHSLISEQDRQLQGKIIAHLTLENNRLVGTVTNTLTTSLSEVYVLLPHSFVSIGRLLAGETQQINLLLQKTTAKHASTLADQIAATAGLSTPYFPYASDQQPQTDMQRHLAILSALGGIGFPFAPCSAPCITQALVSKGAVITAPAGTPLEISLPTGSDPLLLKGAVATLIGWADQPLDGTNQITINGAAPHGFHDNLVQLPLNINFAGAVSPGMLAGNLINEYNSDAADIAPDTYSLSVGSVTFEFALPTVAQRHLSGLTLTEPNILGNVQPTSSPHSNIDPIQAQLYNWQKQSWDAIVVSSWTFTTTNTSAYVGPGGRVLLQIANANPSGLLIFANPSLSLTTL